MLFVALALGGQSAFADLPTRKGAEGGEPPRGSTPQLQERSIDLLEQEESWFERRGRAFVTFIFLFGAVFVVCLVVYKIQVQELGMPEDEKELAQKMTVTGVGPGVGRKEVVFSALNRAEAWVTPGRVALSTDLSAEQAEELLSELLAEGRIKSGRDKKGRRLYKVVA